ncbi:hypothetical protein J5X84_07910 [Streptosporangiaceae bacterium NEAU-GS5]|nr:hypothetical protein [Streptosporangiaceae bacterium NEAU-GS5]
MTATAPAAHIAEQAAPCTGSTTSPRGFVQLPAGLLRSSDHSGPAVAAWALYETLMPRALAAAGPPRAADPAGRPEWGPTMRTAHLRDPDGILWELQSY